MHDEYFKLRFLPNEAGEGEGLNNAGVETFLSRPFASVARECGQNSLDARADIKKPVKLKFARIEVPVVEIPGATKLKETASYCLQTAREKGNTREIDFFSKAITLLSEDSIPVLAISDYNTTGADKTAFHALAQSSGETYKTSEDSGGSFGIGKNAAYAVSDLRTVFYASKYSQGEFYQGKTLFRSHIDPSEPEVQHRRGTGYWCKDYKPVTNGQYVPEWMRRSETGTTVFSLGMRSGLNPASINEWVPETVTILTLNFFVAIHEGNLELEVEVPGINFSINKDNIGELITGDKLKKVAMRLKVESEYQRMLALYKCLAGRDTIIEKIEIANAGQFNIFLLIEDGLGHTCGFFRNGMYITNHLKAFGHEFQRFPNYKEFSLLVRPADSSTSTTLKTLENPEHNEFTPERIEVVERRKTLSKAFSRLGNRVREIVREQARAISSEFQELNEMNEFFANDEEQLEQTGDEPSITKMKLSVPVVNSPSPNAKRVESIGGKEQEGESGSGGFSESEEKGGITSGPNPGHGTGVTGSDDSQTGVKFVPSEVHDVRIIRAEGAAGSRTIFFTPEKSGKARMSVFAQGINDDVVLDLLVGSERAVHSRYIEVTCEKGKRQSIELQLESDFFGAVTLRCEIESKTGVEK